MYKERVKERERKKERKKRAEKESGGSPRMRKQHGRRVEHRLGGRRRNRGRRRRCIRMQKVAPLLDPLLVLGQTPGQQVRKALHVLLQRVGNGGMGWGIAVVIIIMGHLALGLVCLSYLYGLHFVLQVGQALLDGILTARHVRYYLVDRVLCLRMVRRNTRVTNIARKRGTLTHFF